jgi:hypothetical protein
LVVIGVVWNFTVSTYLTWRRRTVLTICRQSGGPAGGNL